jgi:hypothetical protein
MSNKATYVTYIIVLFVETPRKFITAVINLRGVSTNKTIIYLIAMQTYKELILCYIIHNSLYPATSRELGATFSIFDNF